MAQVIASLGSNISARGFVAQNDIALLRGAIEGELTRRSITHVIDTTSLVFSAFKHVTSIIENCKKVDSAKILPINQHKIVSGKDLDSITEYIQVLENEVCVN